MFEILMYIAIALVVVIGVVLAVASSRPDTFAIRRSARIAAPAERIFPLIANLKSMNTWNPFVEPDPAIRIAYSGPEVGKGATNTWAGNRHVGEGSIEVLEAVPSSRVAMRLLMHKPMKADNTVEFTLQPSGSATDVTWQMSGRQPLMAKVMAMFIDCDKMVGRQFEKGLGKLKGIAEG